PNGPSASITTRGKEGYERTRRSENVASRGSAGGAPFAALAGAGAEGAEAARAAEMRARGAIFGTTFERNSSGTSHRPPVTTAGADSTSGLPLISTRGQLRVTTTSCRPRVSRARTLSLVHSALALSATATLSRAT